MSLPRSIDFTVEKEVIEHSLKPSQVFVLQPRQIVSTQRHLDPFGQGTRFLHAQRSQLRPDRNSWIGCKQIWREAYVPKLAGDFTHGSEGDNAVGFCLSR